MLLWNKQRRFWQARILLPLLMVALIGLVGCITQVSKENQDTASEIAKRTEVDQQEKAADDKGTNGTDQALKRPEDASSSAASRALDLSYIPSSAMSAVVLAPKEILSAEAVQLYPIEVLEALSERHLGINVKEIDQAIALVQFSEESPDPQVGLIVRLSQPHKLDDLFPTLQETGQLEKVKVDGRPFGRIDQIPPISFTMADEKTVLLGTGEYVSQMLAAKSADSPLIKLLKQVDANHQVVAVVSVDMVPEIYKKMLTDPTAVPPTVAPYLGAVKQLSALEINIDLDAQFGGELVLHSHDPEEAKQLEQLILQGLEFGKQMFLAQASQIDSGDEVVDVAMQKYMVRMADYMVKMFQPTRDASRLSLDSNATVGLATTGVMVAMLLPAVQSARFAARKMSSGNNLKQIGIALHNYHETYGQFPVGESPGEDGLIKYKDGKQLLSWRVHLLPFVEADGLYEQFKLDEPWDSPHNIKLLDQIPPVYVTPHHDLGNRTVYVAPMGPNATLGSGKRVRFRDITDGTSLTIAVIEAGPERAVPWTKPVDLPIDKDDPAGSVGAEQGAFQVLFCDGSVHSISITVEPKQFYWMIQRNDGNPINQNAFDVPGVDVDIFPSP